MYENKKIIEIKSYLKPECLGNCFKEKPCCNCAIGANRQSAIKWMITMYDALGLTCETLIYSIWIYDYYMSKNIKSTDLNMNLLVVCTCLFIGSKLGEPFGRMIYANQLKESTDHAYPVSAFVNMERKILKSLNYNVSFMTPIHYIHNKIKDTKEVMFAIELLIGLYKVGQIKTMCAKEVAKKTMNALAICRLGYSKK